MNKATVACGGLVLALLVGVARAEVIRLDFGPTDAPLRAGFERVSAEQRAGAGVRAGWVGQAEGDTALEAVDFPVPREPFPPAIYTTDLRQDSVQGRGAATLRVMMPAGRYRVWLMVGTGGGGWSQVWDMRISNALADSEAAVTFFGGYTARLLELDAEADALGHLDLAITTRSKWAINAMVVAPEAAWADVRREEIDALEQGVRLLPPDVLRDWQHTPHVESTPEPTYTASERERGFVVYARPWVTPIWPNTNPRREEFDPSLRAFLSLGEYVPMTFTVKPLRAVGAATVEATDLRSESGALISADNIELRYVQYKYVRPNYKTFGTYYRAPSLLPMLDGPVALTTGENFRVWMTVYAQPDAEPGIYRGAARLSLDGETAAEVPIAVRVLPISLETDPTVTYSTYYRHPWRYLRDAPDAFSRQWWQTKIDSDMVSMASHGYNGFRPDISAGFTEAGEARADLSKWASQLDAARAAGMDVNRPTLGDLRSAVRALYRSYMGKEYPLHLFNVEMPPEQFFEQITALIERVEAERRAHDLPELLYSLVDEPAATPESIAYTHRLYEAAKQVPGIRTYTTVEPGRSEYAVLHDVIDVWSSPFMHSTDIDRAELAAKGIEVWCYPNAVAGENDHTPVAGARMTYGFARWRLDVPALIPWIFESWGGDPSNNLDALQMDMFNQTTDDGQVLPCTLYEAYREGIDDGRYVTTLENTITRAREAGLTDAADAAQADLDFVRAAVPVKPQYRDDAGWSDDSFDAYRWIVARRILFLQEALDE